MKLYASSRALPTLSARLREGQRGLAELMHPRVLHETRRSILRKLALHFARKPRGLRVEQPQLWGSEVRWTSLPARQRAVLESPAQIQTHNDQENQESCQANATTWIQPEARAAGRCHGR